MQVSQARLNTIRGVLAVSLIWWLFFGIGGIFFPNQLVDSIFQVPFTPALQTLSMELGAFVLGWAVALAIALRDPLGHRGLVQAIIATMVIFFIVEVYLTITVGSEWPGIPPVVNWVSNALLIILAVAIGIAYPWREATT